MKSKILTACACILFVFVCKHQTNDSNTKIESAGQLKPVFDNYFTLKDALVKTDATTASAKATLLLEALNAVKPETLNTEGHSAWGKLEKDLKSGGQHISDPFAFPFSFGTNLRNAFMVATDLGELYFTQRTQKSDEQNVSIPGKTRSSSGSTFLLGFPVAVRVSLGF